MEALKKNDPVFARSAIKADGVTTGGHRRCQLSGCTGRRIGVRWESGKMTWPCSKGMERVDTAWRIL